MNSLRAYSKLNCNHAKKSPSFALVLPSAGGKWVAGMGIMSCTMHTQTHTHAHIHTYKLQHYGIRGVGSNAAPAALAATRRQIDASNTHPLAVSSPAGSNESVINADVLKGHGITRPENETLSRNASSLCEWFRFQPH